MAEVSLAVELRTQTGKGTNRRLRVAGRIPGVVYGGNLSSVPISLDPMQLDQLIRTSHAGVNTLIDLTGPSEVAGRTVLVKELQREPVRGALLHADLYEVNQNVRLRVSVPIHLRGSAQGVTMGGLIDHALRVVELDCLPRAIPDEILVDVSALGIGDSIHVRDLSLPEGVDLHTQGDLPVVSVVSPKLEEEPVAAEGMAPVEPGIAGAAGEQAGGEESKES